MKKQIYILPTVLFGIIMLLTLSNSCKKEDDNSQSMSCDTAYLGTSTTFFKIINTFDTEIDVNWTVNNPPIPYSALLNGLDCVLFGVVANQDYTVKISKWNQGQERLYNFNLTTGEIHTIQVNDGFFN